MTFSPKIAFQEMLRGSSEGKKCMVPDVTYIYTTGQENLYLRIIINMNTLEKIEELSHKFSVTKPDKELNPPVSSLKVFSRTSNDTLPVTGSL